MVSVPICFRLDGPYEHCKALFTHLSKALCSRSHFGHALSEVPFGLLRPYMTTPDISGSIQDTRIRQIA